MLFVYTNLFEMNSFFYDKSYFPFYESFEELIHIKNKSRC